MSAEASPDTPHARQRGARAELRRRLVERRLALSPQRHAELSAALCAQLAQHFASLATQRVGFCWPVKNEADLRPLIGAWASAGTPGFAALLPVVVDTGCALTFRAWRPGDELVADRYGIPTPMRGDFVAPQALLLPDLPGIGSWMLSSTGWNAAAELAGAADLLQRASAQGVLIPARLRLEQRTSVKAGQTRKFAVPVIDIDVSFASLLGATPPQALPAGYTPLNPGSAGPTLTEGLQLTQGSEVTRRPNGQTPIPPQHEDIQFGDAPVAVPVEPETADPVSAGSANLITVAQRRRLFAIAKKAGVDKDQLKEFVRTYTNQESTAGIPVDAYEPLCDAIEKHGAPA